MALDRQKWQEICDSAASRYRVPGAVLGVLADGEVTTWATGVLHRGTGVETTVDSLFQIGSITKVWTTTLLLQLVAEGRLSLTTRVADVLPGFEVADPLCTQGLTIEHLLTHSSGIDGDIYTDTGRGDDCLRRYVADLGNAAQNHPLGATMSYCNSGFILAGRVIEVLTGKVWDEVLRERLIEPLGLEHTVTLPEEALRFRVAMGHLGSPGEVPEPAPAWSLMRAAGPAGLITATAADVLAFARMHLDAGRSSDGSRILPAALVRDMQQPRVEVPDRWSVADHWGLGWFLCDWNGRKVYGHDGGTIGQSAFLRIDPETGVAVVLLTNGGNVRGLFAELFAGLFAELSGITMPCFEPPANPPAVDGSAHVGTYQRTGERVTVSGDGSRLVARVEATGLLADLSSHQILQLRPLSNDVWATRVEPEGPWNAMCFYRLADGQAYVHYGMRATPKVG